ncbi:MAG TPA: hypothetical protein VHC70_03335 [Phycisphaerales bacterium]|nr:hypothetical protein [Phycisphaerales bacterium]
MNVLIISGRTARQPWTSSALVAGICRALASRGHAVTLACQSLDDPAQFASCSARHEFDTFDQTATDWPLMFAAWARRKQRTIAHDVSLSLSRTAGGDVWMPVEPGGRSWLARARRTLSVKSLAIALARNHGAIRSWAVDAAFAAPRVGDGSLRRVIAVGATSTGEATRALHRVHGLGERVVKAEPFGVVEPPPKQALAHLRDDARRSLAIPSERRVLLVSAPLPVGSSIDGLIEAVRELGDHDQARGPMLLVLARDCYALHARARRLGADRHVRITGLTERMDAALAAADAVALPHKAEGGLFASGATGRLGVDALRFGKPILALSGAGGYGLARLRAPSQDFPGLVVDYPTSAAWMRAIRQVGDDGWLERTSAAARSLGEPMRFERLVDRLENVLSEAAAERAAELGRR